MKTVAFTDSRKRASDLITGVEHGETLVLLRHGKPVAEVVPFSDRVQRVPAWKPSGVRLRISGGDLSYAILRRMMGFATLHPSYGSLLNVRCWTFIFSSTAL